MSDNGIAHLRARSSSVRLEKITKMFRSHDGTKELAAVDNIDLEVRDGELVTLLGPSGCGKTTTLRMVSGFESPTGGEIFIGDRPVVDVPPNKRDISMVFQSYALFPHLTIWENVAYGLRLKKLPKADIQRRTEDVIALMQLKGMEQRYPNQLSGGQQQRVALARAVIIEPRVLLFDEPLSNLDAKLREHMRDELRALQQRLGITSLYVTHDQSEAMAISDKVVIMKGGLIMQQGSPKEIYEYPANRFVANFIGKTNFIPCILRGREDGKAVVSIADKELRFVNPGAMDGVADGGTCALSVRPESVRLSSTEGEIAGEVRRVTYYGARIEYEILMGGEPIVVESTNPQLTEQFSVGQTAFLSLDNQCVRVLQ